MSTVEPVVDEIAPRRMLGRASLVGAGTACQQGIAFASGLIVARVLGAANYGLISIARNLIDTTWIITRLGLEIGLQRFFGETRDRVPQAARLTVLRRLRLIASGVAMLPVLAVLLGVGNLLEHHVYHHAGFARVLLCMALALPFMTDLAVLSGAYRGVLKLGPCVLAECVLMPGGRLGIILLLFAAGWRLWAVALGTTLGSVIAASWMAWRGRRDFPAVAVDPALGARCWREVRHVISYSTVLSAAVLVATLIAGVDLLMLGHYVNATEVGQYALTRSMLVLISIPGLILNQGLGALVAERWSRGDIAGMRRVLSQALRWVALGSVPLFLVFLLWGDHLLAMFGASFTVPLPVIAWLAAGQLAVALLGPMGWALSMTGRHVQELRILVSGLVVAVLLSWLLIPQLGQLGAAIGNCGALVYMNVARVVCIRLRLGVWPVFLRGGGHAPA